MNAPGASQLIESLPRLAGGWSANQRSYGFDTEPNGALRFPISDVAHQWDAAFHVFDTTNNVIAINKWSHVAAVYDQAAGARRIYVNGAKVAERIDPPITVLNSTAKVGIGAQFEAGPAAYFFDGLIDELSFYSSALSTAEIQAIYNAGSAGKCVPPPPPPPTNGLVAWYPLNGNANDASGHGNHGTVNGATLISDRFGNTNSAYNFDGVSSEILLIS